MDEVAHGPDGFFNRRVRIGPVTEEKIEIVDLQAMERVVARGHDVLAAQSFLVGQPAAPENLARDEIRFMRPAHLLEDVAHDDLGAARRIGLGVVEEIDAAVVGGLHQVGRDFVRNLLPEGDP